MDRTEAVARLAQARVAHLATVRPDGGPHVVPVTFAVVGGNIVTAIDQKPKTTRDLQRLENIRANRVVSLLADHYDEDWTRLWWVRVDGPASMHEGGRIFADGVEALVEKYPQYREQAPDGPLIAISQDWVLAWEA